MRLIDADALIEHLKNDPLFDLVEQYGLTRMIETEITIEAIPIAWLTAQAENPSNSDEVRNAIDHIVYRLWAEKKEE